MITANRLPALLVIVASLVVAIARIAMVEGAFSANDRSRWAAIRALAENDTFAIGSRALENGTPVDRGIVTTPGWTTVDVVMDPATGLFYSSKPPLLAYLASFPVKACIAAGFTLDSNRPFVTRVVLVLFQLFPFALALLALERMLEQLGRNHPSSLSALALPLALATVGLGSLFASFVVTLNPHVIAGSAAIVALWAASASARTPLRLAAAGVCAGIAAAFEPTALAFLVLLAVALVALVAADASRAPRAIDAARVAVFFGVAAALPIGLHLVTTAAVFGDALHFMGPLKEWYRFAGSYWQTPSGIDVDDPRIASYALHLLVGHHGFFSITPALALGAMGTVLVAFPSTNAKRATLAILGIFACFTAARALRVLLDVPWQVALVVGALPALALFAACVGASRAPQRALAIVVVSASISSLAFYILHTSNYGGVALGPRWFLWLVPMLALGIPRAIDALPFKASTTRSIVTLALVAIGALLAFPLGGLNPWQHPRLFTPLIATDDGRSAP